MAVRNSVGITGSAVGRREPCAKCGYPVFLAERLHVGPKLYHRTCFRCARCDNQLSLANCYETETDGQYCCETCPDEEDATNAQDITDSKFSSLTDLDNIRPDTSINSSENLIANQTELTDVKPENNVQSKIKLFDISSKINDFNNIEGKHVPKEMRNRSLSDEEKSKGLQQFDEDEYSSYFENALEEANDKIVQDDNVLSKARNNFLSTHLLNEDFDEIETKDPMQTATFDDIEDEFESLYKELTHEEKTKVAEFDEMKIDYIDTPPPLPSSTPPDISASLSNDDQPLEQIIESIESFEGKPDEAVVKTEPETDVNSSDKDSVKEDQQLTASDARVEEVKNITDKNVTKDTNRLSLVKSRMLIFENAEKSISPATNVTISKETKQFGESKESDLTNVPSENEVIVVSDTNSSILSTKQDSNLSACENSIGILSDTSVTAIDVEPETDGSLKLLEPIIIISDESQVINTPSDIDSSYEDKRKCVKYDPDISDSVSVDSSLSKNPPVDTQAVIVDRMFLSESLFENTSLNESRVTIDSSILETSESSKPDLDYPEDLNPFGDEDEGECHFSTSKITAPNVGVGPRPVPVPRKGRTEMLKSTNPFGSSEDEVEEEVVKTKPPLPPQPTIMNEDGVRKLIKAPRVSLNPFWSEEEEPSDEDALSKPVPLPRTSKPLMNTPEPRSRRSGLSKNGDPYDSNSSLSSMSSSISHTPGRKKKPAPPPPTQMSAGHHLSPQTSKHTSPQLSPKLTPRVRKNRKAPLPPTSTPSAIKLDSDGPNISPINESPATDKFSTPANTQQVNETPYFSLDSSVASSDLEKEKITKDEKNRNRQSQNLSSPLSEPTSDSLQLQSPVLDKSTHGKWKRKKGPAPARPVPQRRQIKPLPLTELRRELDIIEMQQQGLEKQGVKLEQLIREKCEGPGASDDTALSPEVEELVLELFELVNEKNELFRRQAELMYLRRQQRLEEEYADLEYQIRCLMDRPERNKTDSDKAREEELINRLVEVVERRNEIVECLEMDRVREAEEDQSINSRLNSIAAKREEETQSAPETPVKLSKKEKKKIKKEKKLKEKGKNLDVDKDIDESESSLTSMKEKKKKKWF